MLHCVPLKELEDVCFFDSLFHPFRQNADIHIIQKPCAASPSPSPPLTGGERAGRGRISHRKASLPKPIQGRSSPAQPILKPQLQNLNIHARPRRGRAGEWRRPYFSNVKLREPIMLPSAKMLTVYVPLLRNSPTWRYIVTGVSSPVYSMLFFIEHSRLRFS